jgi:hypothetical protein
VAFSVGAGRNALQAFQYDRVRQYRGGGGAVAGDIVGFGGRFLEQLRAHVLKGIFQFDFLGDRHTVVGDRRGPEFFIERDVAPFGAEGGGDRIGKDFDSLLQPLAGLIGKNKLFCAHSSFSWFLSAGEQIA